MKHRDAAQIAAIEAMQVASATVSLLRCLSLSAYTLPFSVLTLWDYTKYGESLQKVNEKDRVIVDLRDKVSQFKQACRETELRLKFTCEYNVCMDCRGRSSKLSNHTTVKILSFNRIPQKFDFNQGAQIQKVLKSCKLKRFCVIPNSNDGYPSLSVSEEDTTTSIKDTSMAEEWENGGETFLSKWSPPRYLWRGLSVLILAGQVIIRIIKGKIHWRNTLQQLERVGPKSVGVCLLTAAFVGMAFTIQFVREFTRLGLNRSVGGVLALAFSRELSPVVTSIVVAGRIGSAFAAELGTMQVSEQTDTLRVLGANPVDYLVTPRVIASCIALPFLTLMCFTLGMASSALLADGVYGISINIILDSAQRALRSWDIVSAMIKSQVFGAIISIISCAWGVTTMGGAKGVGESTTSAVVLSLVGIFIADFALSYCFFQGAGDSLKNCV
ncbi:Protein TRIGALACTOSYLDIACYLGLYCEROL 1, chloroplastic [Capsicum baccatum]|uniref:Protein TRIGALACTOSYLDIACYLGLYCEROL 1, chloroplastic n=1 Tax=Capsicum baccatum TaxID=33114 RepID=A0A2G2W2E7_CAPBA|nr:Protein TRIGALACTOSYLDIACYLGLYCEROL 1, chloroplastic [Capsicum baccatum]